MKTIATLALAAAIHSCLLFVPCSARLAVDPKDTAANAKEKYAAAQPTAQTDDSSITFWLKPLGSRGRCGHLINGKLGTDKHDKNTYCGVNEEKGKFRLRADGSLWSQGMELVWKAADGEISAAQPEYRAQNDAAQAQKFGQQSFKFEFVKCGKNKVCLSPADHQVSPKWEVVTEAWRRRAQ